MTENQNQSLFTCREGRRGRGPVDKKNMKKKRVLIEEKSQVNKGAKCASQLKNNKSTGHGGGEAVVWSWY